MWRIPAALIQPAAVVLSQQELIDPEALSAALCDFPLLLPWIEAVRLLVPRLSHDKPRKLLEVLVQCCSVQNDAVSKLLNAAVFHEDLSRLLASLRMDDSADIRRVSGSGYASGAVHLMTLHGAKGLEFLVVFLAGLTAGSLPLERAHAETDVNEERRLFFVGMTRAREELILSCGGKPSVFADELPKEILRGDIRPRNKTPKTEQLSLFDF